MAEIIKFGNYLYDHGYTMVSNLLIDYQNELDLSNDEVMFIIKVYRHKSGYKLHDKNLDETLSSKTLQRRRKSLQEKGFLDFKIYKSNTMDGSITTDGIVYDFSQLEMRLVELSNEIKEKEAPVVIKPIKEENTIDKFKNLYSKEYGVEYKPSKAEKELVSRLSKEEKNAVKYIFDYCNDNLDNLPENFHPRLAFFLNVDWRMKKLVEYANEKDRLILEELERKEISEKNKVAEKEYCDIIGDKEKEFDKWLLKNNKKLFLLKRNGLMINIVDDIKEEIGRWKDGIKED